jgi:hypothetical protein
MDSRGIGAFACIGFSACRADPSRLPGPQSAKTGMNSLLGAAASPSTSYSHRFWRFSGGALQILILSTAIQLVIGLLFGHVYDIRIFMAAGHQVATLQNPYLPHDLSAVFHNPAFHGITTVGYPPPWPLILGGIYRLTYAALPNFLAYNLAIKLPIIIANVALAYLTAACLRRLGADEARARTAWVFMLLNPFLLYASAAWGQFDSIVALLSLAGLALLDSPRRSSSAILLALAVSFKPTAIPLLLLPFFYLAASGLGQVLRFYAVLGLGLLAFCIGPFVFFGWDPSPILQNWNAHLVVGGGLSPLAALELWQTSYRLSGNWWLLGLLWIPALGIASLALRSGIPDFKDLVRKSAASVLVFFLTRSWLSEPNLILVLPFVVILASLGELPSSWLHVIWILPLLFGIVNVSAAQLFFPSMPHLMEALLKQMEELRTARLIAKVVVVVPWQIVGWLIVVRCLRRPAAAAGLTN